MRHLGRRIGIVVGASVLALAGTACGNQAQQESQPRNGSQSPSASAPGSPGSGQKGRPSGAPSDENGDSGSGGGSTGAPGSAPDKPASNPSGGARLVPQGQIIDPGPQSSSDKKRVWRSGDGRTVTVVGQEGGCSNVSAKVAEQGAQKVRVSVVETIPTKPGLQCTMDIRYPKLSVQLDEPLAERTIVVERSKQKK
ncbi:MAG: hypothetical protein GEU98_11340 [Pseudonocardiaceae bacterium]|nr:hypothetical protein [Pseudonocardiaceae bacterium]